MKNVMCLTKELRFPLLVNPLHCSHQLHHKSQKRCVRVTWAKSLKNTPSCSSITADQGSKPPSKCSDVRHLIWWAWPGWSACSTSDTQQTGGSLQKSSSNFPPLCLWSRAHQWEEQHSCLLSPGKKDKLTINSYSKCGAEIILQILQKKEKKICCTIMIRQKLQYEWVLLLLMYCKNIIGCGGSSTKTLYLEIPQWDNTPWQVKVLLSAKCILNIKSKRTHYADCLILLCFKYCIINTIL